MNWDWERQLPDCLACEGCGDVNDYYMVHDRVWSGEARLPKSPKMLCVSCLEERLGRRLTFDDYTDCVINVTYRYGHMLAGI